MLPSPKASPRQESVPWESANCYCSMPQGVSSNFLSINTDSSRQQQTHFHSTFLTLTPPRPFPFLPEPMGMNSPSCRSHDAAPICCRGGTAASRIMIHAKIVSHLMGNGSSNSNGIIRVVLCKVKEAHQHFTCACPVHLWVNGVRGISHLYM